MNTTTILKRVKAQKIGRLPIVVLPLVDYERMKEDLEMFYSRTLTKEIKKAREEVKKEKILTFAEAKRRLKLS